MGRDVMTKVESSLRNENLRDHIIFGGRPSRTGRVVPVLDPPPLFWQMEAVRMGHE